MKRILAIKKNKSSEKNKSNKVIWKSAADIQDPQPVFSIIDSIIYDPPEAIYMGFRKQYIWAAGSNIYGLPEEFYMARRKHYIWRAVTSGMVFRREGQISDR